MTNATPWLCHAVPAATGKPCGAFNADGGVTFSGIRCCATCGCTKKASDDRLARKQQGHAERRSR